MSTCLHSSGEELGDKLSLSDEEDLSDDDDTPTGLGVSILAAWTKRKKKLDHDHAVAGWALGVMAEVRADAKKRMTGAH